jgi:MFS family permease
MSWLSFRRWWLVAFVLGVLSGVLWWAITDTATFTVTKDGTSLGDDEMRLQFGAIVSFVLIGAGVCALLGFAVAYVSDLSWPAIPAVALLCGQAAVLAWLVGRLLGPDDPKRKGPIGTKIQDALTVDAVAPFFAWAAFGVAGVLIGLALVSHEPSGDRR